ncbi:sugar ABC transporter permease [Desulfosporosinus sp. FKA]|uniref:carbohydrate ABC transporter permease n=1 Tax=Desulfosporosinus sp. FKA TaxID=1969834 RepID=UPI000B4A1407|nr:sugar ABC transporter permease [Desulfosporosinus sp. FKA]
MIIKLPFGRYEKQNPQRLLLKPSFNNRKLKTSIIAWLLILPSFIFLVLFTLYPIVKTFINSLYLKDLAHKIPQFIGLANYQNLIKDQVFLQAVHNNMLVALITVPASILLALIMAILANAAVRGRGIVRAGYFYPTLLPMIAVANIWLFIYTPGYGLLSYAERILGLGGQINLLGSSSTVLPALMVMLIWKEAGYFMLFFLAGLQSIPRELYEASRIDGAGSWQVFRKITWPMLTPTTLFVLIISLTNAFKTVDHLYIMTNGGPDNASNMILYYIYQLGFEFWDVGKASAVTALLVLFLLIITCVKFFTLDKKAYYS